MQKIIRRTQYAIAQAERRKLRRRAIDIRDKWSNKNANADAGKREHIKALKKARLEQKEDWELGPLAPRRDVGDKKDTYGTVHPFSIDDAANIPESEREAGRERFGGKYYCSVKEGDRVVVLAGRDKGTISKVLEVNAKKGAVKVQGVDLVDVAIPEWMQTNIPEDQRRATQTVERLIPMNNVRLITALYTPETGETRDVIVKGIDISEKKRDLLTGKYNWVRKIHGTNIVIPWPKEDEPEKVDHSVDTLRIVVEEKTFIPTLLRPPMPESVIDELRNKFSAFRTRHTEEYIAAKEAEEAEKKAKVLSIKKMRTPLSEKNRKERKLRKQKGKGVLTEDMMMKLGQVIARNKGVVVKEKVEKPVRVKQTVKQIVEAPPPGAELSTEPVVEV